jgi:hypothetical protein
LLLGGSCFDRSRIGDQMILPVSTKLDARTQQKKKARMIQTSKRRWLCEC